MDAVSQYAGFLAAHNIDRLSKGESVIPILAYEKADGSKDVLRLPEPLSEGLSQASQWLADNPEDATQAVVVFVGSVVINRRDVDTLICRAVQYQPEKVSLKFAVPFERLETDPGFVVYRVKIIDYDGPPDPDFDAMVGAFFEGVEQNEAGADVWFAHLDQSK